MSVIVAKKSFSKPIEEVYSYITTPVNWPLWFKGTLKVDGGNRPVKQGDTWEETLCASGNKMHVSWYCTRSDTPFFCSFDGHLTVHGWLGCLSKGAILSISYELKTDRNETLLVRTLKTHFPNPILRTVARLKRNRTAREIQVALETLKLIIDGNN